MKFKTSIPEINTLTVCSVVNKFDIRIWFLNIAVKKMKTQYVNETFKFNEDI